MTTNTLDNETDLLLMVSKGDERAFCQLFNHYWNKIYGVALMLTKSSAFSQELVQDIFLKIWLNRDQLISVRKFEGYLSVIARNHIFDELRKKSNQSAFAEQLDQHFSESFSLPEQMMIVKETSQLIEEAVKKLPEQQRLVYTLSRTEGLDYHAIANQLGITRSTVKNHMTKALHTLRQYLSRHLVQLTGLAVIIKILK